MRPSTSRRIVFAVYDGVALFELSGPLEAFRIATEVAIRQPPKAYECIVISSSGGRVRTASGADLNTKSLRSLAGKPIDTLLVPGAFSVEDVIRDRALIRWFRNMAPACRRVCSVCSGSFLLAAAGILDGHRAATHWAQVSRLAAQHPNVIVEPDAIYVRDRRVWTSAGGTSCIDLALALIEQDAGRKVALKVAQFLVVYLKRAGGQSQYSALLDAQGQSDSDRFAELEQWIVEHLNMDLGVRILAQRVHMSPRNFARVYTQARGRTPAKAVEAIRIDAARRRLEETTERIESIAEQSGFTGEEQMRTAFIRSLGIPPREYRKRFASTAS